MSAPEAAALAAFVLTGAVCTSIGYWWYEARTTWLSRVGARGLLRGRYTPWRADRWWSPRWLLTQRPALTDFVDAGRLEESPDADRTTEVWRIRMLRRWRVLLLTAPAVLLAPALMHVLVSTLEWTSVVVVVAVPALVLAYPARRLYRRVVDWGNA